GECFRPALQSSTTATQSSPSGGGIVPGSPASDTATVSGDAGTPGGTVTFFLCGPSEVTANGCESGGTQVGDPVALDAGGQAASASSTTTTAIGTYCWRAVYSGDGVYSGSPHTDSAAGCFTTVQQPAPVATSSTPTGTVAPGASATDTATVSGGGPTPTGTVTFFLCDPATVGANGCTAGGSAIGSAKTLVGGQATSDATAALTAAGEYCWR